MSGKTLHFNKFPIQIRTQWSVFTAMFANIWREHQTGKSPPAILHFVLFHNKHFKTPKFPDPCHTLYQARQASQAATP
jgi:hypothetical protein